MPQRSDDAILLDVATAAQRISAFIEGMSEEQFHGDIKTQAAVQHQILVIGEAAKRLTPETRERVSDVPWSAIARMRDRLIHGYDSVDEQVVWQTAVVAVPQLLTAIAPMLPPLSE